MTADTVEVDELQAIIDAPYVIPRMKGRRYKARLRADARWRRDPVVRCECGAEYLASTENRTCPFGCCVQFFCRCGRHGGGFGPVECPCDRGGYGHGRYAEQPRPKVAVKR